MLLKNISNFDNIPSRKELRNVVTIVCPFCTRHVGVYKIIRHTKINYHSIPSVSAILVDGILKQSTQRCSGSGRKLTTTDIKNLAVSNS